MFTVQLPKGGDILRKIRLFTIWTNTRDVKKNWKNQKCLPGFKCAYYGKNFPFKFWFRKKMNSTASQWFFSIMRSQFRPNDTNKSLKHRLNQNMSKKSHIIYFWRLPKHALTIKERVVVSIPYLFVGLLEIKRRVSHLLVHMYFRGDSLNS